LSLRFGTDGIRGVANTELTPELSLAIGLAAARVIGEPGQVCLIGRDTRHSGSLVETALTAGLLSSGVSVVDLGVVPTPAVAFLSAERNVMAAMISASHNPYADNGIKFFLPGGRKLSDDIEEQLETTIESGVPAADRVTGSDVGSVSEDHGGVSAYEQHLVSTVPGRDLSGLHVVLDCANGAASRIAPEVLSLLGARTTVLFDQPNGRNINENCGSTHPEQLQKTVAELGADLGLAFDGDADRVLAVDHQGNLIDGDHILAMLAIDAKSQGALRDDTLVTTVMANLGLKIAMENSGIAVHETAVGDRYVLEALEAGSYSLGGEQSGHVIIPAYATTGDGLLTGLQIAALVKKSGRSLSELAAVVTKLPQVLRNVRVRSREALADATVVWQAVEAEQQKLGKHGRVLLRPSGTEPVVRVMVEAMTQEIADEVCARLCLVVESELA
jgi:phosphoglucosamine mutase